MKNAILYLFFWMVCFLILANKANATAEIVSTNNMAISNDNPCSLKLTVTPDGIYCGASRGAIDVSISGGAGPFLIEWDNLNNSIWAETITADASYKIADLPAGKYVIKVMDNSNGCFVMEEVELKKGVFSSNLSVQSNGVKCNGFGSLSVSIKDADPPYYFQLEGPTSGNYIAHSNTFKIYNLIPGDYTIKFDQEGCNTASEISISLKGGVPELNLQPEVDNCADHTGNVTANINAKTSSYSLSWEGPIAGSITESDDNIIKNLPSGIYIFTLTNEEGCIATKTLAIDRTGLSVQLTTTSAICDQNGSVKVNIAGGSGNYTINWTGAGQGSKTTTRSIETIALPQGTYVFTITNNATGCSIFSQATVAPQITDLYCSITPRATTCGKDNGELEVFISGGEKPYILSYTGPVSGSVEVNGTTTFSDLPAGVYTTILRDQKGCMVSESGVIEMGEIENTVASFDYSAGGLSVNFFNFSSLGTALWTFGDGNSSTELSPSYTYDSPGTYEVCLEVTGKCNIDKMCQSLEIKAFVNKYPNVISGVTNLSNLSQNANSSALKIHQNFPNPFSESTNILFELSEAAKVNITIQDHFGRIIQSVDNFYEKGHNQFTFNQNNLASGFYYYTLTTGDSSTTIKMVAK